MKHLKQCVRGEKVRRASWGDHYYVTLRGDRSIYSDDVMPYSDDLFAEDWEIFDDQPHKCNCAELKAEIEKRDREIESLKFRLNRAEQKCNSLNLTVEILTNKKVKPLLDELRPETRKLP